MEALIRIAWFVTRFSPFAFLIFPIPRGRLRLGIFLPLAVFPGALLIFALAKKAVVIPCCGMIFVEPAIMGFASTSLGLLLMMKAERKARTFFVSLLGTIIAGVPLLISLIFVAYAIITAPPND